VRFRRLPHNPDLPLPARATPDSAGYDVRSAEEDLVLEPGETRALATGLVLELPTGMECQVRPRSGLAFREGLIVPNAPGTIDPDYRGEVRVLLMNLSRKPVSIARGDRIAQFVFARFEAPEIVTAERVGETDRGEGGFGSTGRD
jgi:dUTP pyrophosphatase